MRMKKNKTRGGCNKMIVIEAYILDSLKLNLLAIYISLNKLSLRRERYLDIEASLPHNRWIRQIHRVIILYIFP